MRTQKFSDAWFPIPEDPDKTEFKIKHLRAGEKSKIVGITQTQRFSFETEKKLNKETNEMEDVQVPVPSFEMNTFKAEEMKNIEAVTGWKNVFDADGELMEYSEKNKIKFFDELSEPNYLAAMKHIKDSRKALADQIEKQEKKTLKN